MKPQSSLSAFLALLLVATFQPAFAEELHLICTGDFSVKGPLRNQISFQLEARIELEEQKILEWKFGSREGSLRNNGALTVSVTPAQITVWESYEGTQAVLDSVYVISRTDGKLKSDPNSNVIYTATCSKASTREF